MYDGDREANWARRSIRFVIFTQSIEAFYGKTPISQVFSHTIKRLLVNNFRSMVKTPYMNTTDLKRLIAESGLSDRQISLRCGEREDFVRDIKQGGKPVFDSVFRLLKVLGYEVHITPIEGGEAGLGESAKSVKTQPGFYTFEDEEEAAPELELGCDRRIAEALATLAEHYEQNNEYGRQHFIEEIKERWPELFREEDAAEPGRRRFVLRGCAGSRKC